MYHRRHVLFAGAAAFALANSSCTRRAVASASAGDKPARLAKLYDKFMDEALDKAPEFATSLGLDTGARAKQKALLGDSSLARRASDKADTTRQLKELEAIGRDGLTGGDAIGYDVVHFDLASEERANRHADYGADGGGAPYELSQLTGSYQGVPDFLDSQHSIETKEDADAYLSRLAMFATVLDQEIECAKHDAGLGVIPPDFLIDKALLQMGNFRKPEPAQSTMVASIDRRTKAKDIPGDWAAQAAKIVGKKIYPALERQMALLQSWRPKASHDAGVWRLPRGDQYYADALYSQTSTNMTPAEIHQTGLDVVADHTAKIDALLKAAGMTKGTVAERLTALSADPKQNYPDTDAGKEQLIADLNVRVQKIRAMLPKYFGALPKADLLIKRVPKEIEAGAPGGYYQGASLDGKRPGQYYINLEHTGDHPRWTLPSLTYHEGIPGHHLQISIQQEANLPLIRKVLGNNAYVEGWALYAEQLAAEMGVYDDDPLGHIGQLNGAMFRGVRLVVDSGLHAMKWSREKAMEYCTSVLGRPATVEVERYCAWPGQACGYMVGKLKFLAVRDKAKAALGSRFDYRGYHDVLLTNGSVPLSVLDTMVDGYIAANRG